MSSAHSNAAGAANLVDSQDLDACLGYLSLVNGIDGAVIYSHECLVVALGENTQESMLIEWPYFLDHYISNLRQFKDLGFGGLESQLAFSDNKFYQILNLDRAHRFFLVVSGTKGSYELFKLRIERGASAVALLLQTKGYAKG